MGNIQVRLVSYSADYVSDHWYGKGHIVFVVSGAVTIEHKDGRRCEMTAGMSYQVGDDDPSDHRLVSAGGGSIFIVD